MTLRTTPRLLLATLFFAIGAAVYLSSSGAPPRVHLVALIGQALFLALISYVAWGLNTSPTKRLLLLLLVVAVMAPVAAFASSLVIRKIDFHPIYVLIDFFGLMLEAAFFLGLTWAADRALVFVRAIAQRG